MRHKKAPPPPPLPTVSPSTEPAFDAAASVKLIEEVLHTCLDPENPDNVLTPAQHHEIVEMLITDMHLRGVKDRFWLETLRQALRLGQIVTALDSESKLLKVEGLSEKATEIIHSSVEVGMQELYDTRKALIPKLNALMECRPVGAPLN